LPAVQRLQIDEGSEGQRLDNFLIGLWKGVPKTHVYRVIRSGEVRVNKGRAAADTRLALGDELRLPPVRTSPAAEPGARPPAPAREFPVVWEDELLIAVDKPSGVAVHGGSGLSFGVIEALRAIGYDQWICLETEKRWHPQAAPEQEQSLPQFVHYVREHWSGHGAAVSDQCSPGWSLSVTAGRRTRTGGRVPSSTCLDRKV
jgi:hypothetical protein